MLNLQRAETYQRLNEARLSLELIKRLESPNIRVPDPVDVVILRGLYFVHIYAVIEFAVNGATQAILQQITALRVLHVDFSPKVHSVALDGAFTAIFESRKDRWAKRIALLERQFSSDACNLNSAAFSSDLQNVWYKTLVELFDSLGITTLPVPDMRFKQYIDEIVDKRNAVAHGRISPIQATAGLRSSDLEKRYDAASKTIEHLFDCFEGYLQRREFVRQERRAAYP